MTVVISNEFTVRCCACGGEVTFVRRRASTDPMRLLHTLPYCDRFDAANTPDAVVAYLRDCKNALRN